MILSNSEIFRALDERRLITTPEPAPRTAPSDGTRYPFQTSSVDLRLGHEIAYFKDDLPVSIDMRGGKFNTLFGANSISHRITKEQPYYLQTGKFVLGNTLERVELPIMDSDTSLAARVEGRSSLARCGLLVHFTAPTIPVLPRAALPNKSVGISPFRLGRRIQGLNILRRKLYRGRFQIVGELLFGARSQNNRAHFGPRKQPGYRDRRMRTAVFPGRLSN